MAASSISRTAAAIYIIAALIIGLVIGLAVPFRLAAPAQAPATQATSKQLSLALLISNLGNPYFVALRDGALKAVDELRSKGVSVTIDVYDAKDDPSQQTSQIETVIGKRVSAILVNPVDIQAIQPALSKALDAGIPVITTDRDVANKSLRIVFIGTNNVAGAEEAAKTLIRALESSGKPTPWKIVILNGIPGTTAAIDRKKGFHNVLDPLVSQGKVTIVAEEVANFRRDQGLSVTENILARTKFDAIIAANDEMALGAIQAIEGAGLKPGVDVIVVGYDAIPDAVEAVKQGKMFATIAQSPFLQGYWAVYAAFWHVFYGWKPAQDWIPTPTVTVTKDNVGTFSSEVALPRPLP